MSSSQNFPASTDWEPTRRTLHLYAKVVGVVARAHAEPLPKWWHISLKVRPEGLATESIPLPQGSSFSIELDLRRHQILLATGEGKEHQFDMRAGLTANEMGDQVLGAVGELGLTGDYDRRRFDDDEPRVYDPPAAERFLTALVQADAMLKRHRETLDGEVGPVQVWPHGFDLSFEWFGTRVERHEEEGGAEESPAQINFGFFPAEPAYFYANPWPFDTDKLVDRPLPAGARWHVEGWQGTMLPYAEVAGDPAAGERLLSYFGEVYKIASPTLLV